MFKRCTNRPRQPLFWFAVRDLVIVAALLALLFALVGQVHSATVLDASVTLRTSDGGGAYSGGSGTVIDARAGHSLVITCGHIFRDARTNQVTVAFRDGRIVTGTLLKWSLNPDLALVDVPVTAPAYAPLASGVVIVRQPLSIIGQLIERVGNVLTVDHWGNPPYLTVGVNTADGWSGGGMFNTSGELVGVVWGNAGGEAYAVALPQIRAFVGSLGIRETGCHWEQDNCGRWFRVCDNQPAQQTYAPRPSLPSTPQPTSQPTPPAQSTSNSITIEQFNEQNTKIENLVKICNSLSTEVGNAKPCNCDDACASVKTELNQKIEVLAAAIQQLQSKPEKPPETPNYDVIAGEVAKRLKHSATITLLDGTKQTQTKPLGEPLEFIQARVGAK